MFLRNFISEHSDRDMQARLGAYKKLFADYSNVTQENFKLISNAYLLGNIPGAVESYNNYLQKISGLMSQAFKLNLEVAEGSMAQVQETMKAFKAMHQKNAQNLPQLKDMQKMLEKGGFVIHKVHSPLAFAASLAAMFSGGSNASGPETGVNTKTQVKSYKNKLSPSAVEKKNGARKKI
jgi:hypothetical protein